MLGGPGTTWRLQPGSDGAGSHRLHTEESKLPGLSCKHFLSGLREGEGEGMSGCLERGGRDGRGTLLPLLAGVEGRVRIGFIS